MQIQCKNCRSIISVSDINLNTQIARCNTCNSVFSIKDEITKLLDAKREDINLPNRITVNRDINGLKIIRRWFNYNYIILTLFAIIWDWAMVSWYGAAFASGQYQTALFGSLHAIVGIYLTYTVIAGYLNKTYITVDTQSLKIRHGPVPSLGNKSLSVRDIRQLYSKENISYSRNGSPNYSYEEYAITSSGNKIKLLSGLENKEQVLYIEQEIERFLRIKDEPVEDEIPR